MTEFGFVYIVSILDGAFLKSSSCQDMVAGTLIQILACFTQLLASQEQNNITGLTSSSTYALT